MGAHGNQVSWKMLGRTAVSPDGHLSERGDDKSSTCAACIGGEQVSLNNYDTSSYSFSKLEIVPGQRGLSMCPTWLRL